MSGKAYDLVYLPDGKVIDASKEAGVDSVVQLRMRFAGNQFFIDLIRESNIKDVRIKRIAQLLKGLSQSGKEFSDICDAAFDICAKDALRYKGPQAKLTEMKKNMDRAADYAYEYSKRILLYLELLDTTGCKMQESARVTLKTSIMTQKELIYAARWSVIKQMALDVRPPPGPGSLRYGHVSSSCIRFSPPPSIF